MSSERHETGIGEAGICPLRLRRDRVAGSMIDLATAEKISRGYIKITQGKHKLMLRGAPGLIVKDKVKLLLNLIASAVTALPRGGEQTFGLAVRSTAELSDPLQRPQRPSAAVPHGFRCRYPAGPRCDHDPGLLHMAHRAFGRHALGNSERRRRHSACCPAGDMSRWSVLDHDIVATPPHNLSAA